MPPGELVTVPLPVPIFETVNVRGTAANVNVAVTVRAADIGTEHGLVVPEQVPTPPLQPPKVEPVAAAAVSVTAVPSA
jgi:hypothetical protein